MSILEYKPDWKAPPPWFKVHPETMARRLDHLDPAVRMAFVYVHLELWAHGGAMPKRGVRWWKVARVSRAKWSKIEAPVFEAFQDHGQTIGDPELIAQRINYDADCEKKRQMGVRSGEIRRDKSKQE